MDGKYIRKARFFAYGHTHDPPESLTYSNVVSRYSVRIAFTLDYLNDISIWACDIGNAYLNKKIDKISGEKPVLSLEITKENYDGNHGSSCCSTWLQSIQSPDYHHNFPL